MVSLTERRRVLVVVTVLGLAATAAFVHSVALSTRSVDRSASPTASDVKLVEVTPESDETLWPFTSRRRRFETLTLPINVVIAGNASRVRAVLSSRDERARRDAVAPRWRPAHGATRYTYVHGSSPATRGWMDETFQLQDGDYFGTRYHVRAYEGGTGDTRWTALQVHHEHWDWFRLRHTVGSTARGQRYVERQLYGRPAVASVQRRRFANGGPIDADGWATAVSLAGVAVESGVLGGLSLAVLVGVGLGRRSGDGTEDDTVAETNGGAWASLRRFAADHAPPRRRVGLAVSLLVFPPGVRAASLVVEHRLPALAPRPIAATGYALLAVGLPACAAVRSRGLEPGVSAPLAGASVTLGFLLDYVALDVTVVPIGVVGHRFALALVLGLIAAGGSRWPADADDTGRNLLAVGGVLWIGCLLWPVTDRLVPLVVG